MDAPAEIPAKPKITEWVAFADLLPTQEYPLHGDFDQSTGSQGYEGNLKLSAKDQTAPCSHLWEHQLGLSMLASTYMPLPEMLAGSCSSASGYALAGSAGKYMFSSL